MNKLLTFSFIGGDLRQLRVMTSLAEDGYRIKALGFSGERIGEASDIYLARDLEDCLTGADIVVFPVPYSDGRECVNAPFSDTPIFVSEVVRKMNDEQILLAGRIDARLETITELYNVHAIDYMEREELAVLNAIPTAEGAIEIAISETPFTIHGAPCLVIGYGRIGKVLCRSLAGMGADVCAAARKYGDLAWIKANSLRGIRIKDLGENIGKFRLIFNTAPAPILDFKTLSKVRDDCLIIDLASRPGGVDFESAKELGKKVVWALSLPGKVAPEGAGDIMKDAVLNILEELGV